MIDEKKIRKNWASRGFSFGVWEDPPGQIWENYVHDEDELFMLVDVEVTLTIGDTTQMPTIGEEIFIPAGVKHSVKTSKAAGSRWYYRYGILRGRSV